MSVVVFRCPQCGTQQDSPGECDACHEAVVRHFCPNHTPGKWLVAASCPECGATLTRDPAPDTPRPTTPRPTPPRAAPPTRERRPTPAPPPRARPVPPPPPPIDFGEEREEAGGSPDVWDVTETPPPARRADRFPDPGLGFPPPRRVPRELDPRETDPRAGVPDLGDAIPAAVRVGASSIGSCLVRLVIVILVLIALVMGGGFFWIAGG